MARLGAGTRLAIPLSEVGGAGHCLATRTGNKWSSHGHSSFICFKFVGVWIGPFPTPGNKTVQSYRSVFDSQKKTTAAHECQGIGQQRC